MNDIAQGGYQVTQNTLSANPNLAAIYATNDPEAEGAVQALKAAGKKGVKDNVDQFLLANLRWRGKARSRRRTRGEASPGPREGTGGWLQVRDRRSLV